MTFTDGKQTIEIKCIDSNGIEWTKDFFNVGVLEQEEDGTFLVEDCNLLFEAVEDYQASRGDYEGIKPEGTIIINRL